MPYPIYNATVEFARFAQPQVNFARLGLSAVKVSAIYLVVASASSASAMTNKLALHMVNAVKEWAAILLRGSACAPQKQKSAMQVFHAAKVLIVTRWESATVVLNVPKIAQSTHVVMALVAMTLDIAFVRRRMKTALS